MAADSAEEAAGLAGVEVLEVSVAEVPAAAVPAAVGNDPRTQMVPEKDKKIGEFVSRLKEAAGSNLESVILFGSAVAGDFHPEFSNVNLFCVLRDASFAALQALSPV